MAEKEKKGWFGKKKEPKEPKKPKFKGIYGAGRHEAIERALGNDLDLQPSQLKQQKGK